MNVASTPRRTLATAPLQGTSKRDAMPATNEQERTRKLGAHTAEGVRL
jgi:hypothetical protein